MRGPTSLAVISSGRTRCASVPMDYGHRLLARCNVRDANLDLLAVKPAISGAWVAFHLTSHLLVSWVFVAPAPHQPSEHITSGYGVKRFLLPAVIFYANVTRHMEVDMENIWEEKARQAEKEAERHDALSMTASTGGYHAHMAVALALRSLACEYLRLSAVED